MADRYDCNKFPMCKNDATIVVVAVTPQNVGPNADPVDAITKLSVVCDDHLQDPWIEVKRIGDR